MAPTAPDFARYLYWLHYAEGSLMLQLLRESSLDRMLPEPDAVPGMARVRETTRLHLRVIDDTLAASAWFAGDEFTAVVSDELEWWRVVAVLGIRVLAERLSSGDRHSFTLRFVRYRLAVAAEGGA